MLQGIKREGKRILLSFWHNSRARMECIRVNRFLEHYDASVISNTPPVQTKRITFLITRMVRYHGGQTSILRLGTSLSQLGYEVTYAVYKPQSQAEMQLCAKSNLADYHGFLCTCEKRMQLQSDIVIATSWDTVSLIKKMAGYKMYFVQDFEPYFYSFGELFLLARKTYEQGLHMVSLGSWNKEMIEKQCRPVSPIDVIDFPYEKKEYPFKQRDYSLYSQKKELVIAVYLKYYGKRLPCILQYMMVQLKEKFARDGIRLLVKYYGEAKSFHCKGGENLGMLNKQQLLNLYCTADFGVVASLSNISLVPYEMLATGLPVIEFQDGTFSYFFPENCAIMTELDPENMYQKMKHCIASPGTLIQQQKNAREYMDALSWEKSGKQFAEIIEKVGRR